MLGEICWQSLPAADRGAPHQFQQGATMGPGAYHSCGITPQRQEAGALGKSHDIIDIRRRESSEHELATTARVAHSCRQITCQRCPKQRLARLVVEKLDTLGRPRPPSSDVAPALEPITSRFKALRDQSRTRQVLEARMRLGPASRPKQVSVSSALFQGRRNTRRGSPR